jgi:hypothetical protein
MSASPSLSRFNVICKQWGLSWKPPDVKVTTLLDLTAQWMATEGHTAAGALRMTQVLLVDPERPGAGDRAAISALFGPLLQEWEIAGSDPRDVFLLQALVMAVQERGPAVAGLMQGARGLQRGRGRQQEGIETWLESAAHTERYSIPTFRLPWPPPAEPSNVDLADIDQAIQNLRTHASAACTLEVFGPHLMIALSGLRDAYVRLSHPASRNQFVSTDQDIAYMESNKTTNWNLAQYGPQLVRILDDMGAVLSPDFYPLPFASLGHIRQHQNTPWAFSNFAPQLIDVLLHFRAAIKTLAERKRLELWDQSLRIWSQELATTLQNQLPQAVNRPELELLWWGQARYCHALAQPYRRLRTTPAAATWWAAWEVAERAVDLEYAPSAAYLVNTLEDIGIDVAEERPASAWIAELVEQLRPLRTTHPSVVQPTEPLHGLAKADALGLPVTWARLGGLGDATEQVALDMDQIVDRGEFASWILGELLLDRRMAR